MIKNHVKKRFIAAAVCPKCQQRDKIMLVKNGPNEHIECVSCDFRLQQGEPFERPTKPQEATIQWSKNPKE